MGIWEWVSTTTTVDSVLTTLGLGALALLFARDLILTRGQHTRRTADLAAYHARELGEKDARIADIRESRDGYKEATRLERDRADRATDSVREIAETTRAVLHVLQSLDIVLADPTPREGAPSERH